MLSITLDCYIVHFRRKIASLRPKHRDMKRVITFQPVYACRTITGRVPFVAKGWAEDANAVGSLPLSTEELEGLGDSKMTPQFGLIVSDFQNRNLSNFHTVRL
jgi:hypothetical protein